MARSGGSNTGDVKYWDSNYGKTLDELEAFISTAEKGSGEARNEALESAANGFRRVTGMKRNYHLEIKLMTEPGSKAHYTTEKSQKDARLTALQTRLDAEQARSGQSKRDELFGGRRDIETGNSGGGAQTAESKLDEADHYQDKTEEAYKNMIGVLQETEQTADGTALELANQREQMNAITQQAIEIDSMLTRADRLVKVFSKRMMTDKFIQCFGCLNVTVMVAIILYVVIKNVGLPGSEGDTPPDPSS